MGRLPSLNLSNSLKPDTRLQGRLTSLEDLLGAMSARHTFPAAEIQPGKKGPQCRSQCGRACHSNGVFDASGKPYFITEAWPGRSICGVTVPGTPHRRVGAVALEQLAVRADLDDPAGGHHGDPVRVVGGVHAVGDRQHRSAV